MAEKEGISDLTRKEAAALKCMGEKLGRADADLSGQIRFWTLSISDRL